MRSDPQRFLRPPRLPFRHFGTGQVNLPNAAEVYRNRELSSSYLAVGRIQFWGEMAGHRWANLTPLVPPLRWRRGGGRG